MRPDFCLHAGAPRVCDGFKAILRALYRPFFHGIFFYSDDPNVTIWWHSFIQSFYFMTGNFPMPFNIRPVLRFSSSLNGQFLLSSLPFSVKHGHDPPPLPGFPFRSSSSPRPLSLTLFSHSPGLTNSFGPTYDRNSYPPGQRDGW